MKKFLWIVLLIMSMGTMYYFSSQDGDTSTMQSNAAVEIIDKLFDKAREEITLTDDRLISLKDQIIGELKTYDKSYLVRKAAHFTMYALIGGFMMLVFHAFSKQVFFSGTFAMIITFLYAVYDEKRQLTVSGRNGCITDVFIDSCGAFTAIVILSVLILTGRGIKKLSFK